MFEDDSYKANNVHKDLYEALQKSLELDYSNQRLADQEEARKKRRKRRDAPRSPLRSPPSQPPPPPPLTDASCDPGRDSFRVSSRIQPQLISRLDTSDTRYESTGVHITSSKLTQAALEGQTYEVVKVFYPDIIHLQFQMEECVIKMLSHRFWLTGQFWMENHLGSMTVLSISKMKAARYPDFGLELLVPEQMWIEDVCTYDISAKYGIAHWWFNRQKFYIDRHDSPSHRKEVRTHMRILSVVRIKAYSRYGLTTVKEFKIKQLNPGMNTRFWTEKDVTRSKEFIMAIERRLKTRRIYRNLECFVGGRVRDIDYRFFRESECYIFPSKGQYHV
ncbi:hypothetical protein Tco_0819681 [Tanacetum coccineum]|uniref:Uncharacterized protein n=1 Tax=Tanacetum coccineum TaxID=301880 RepID=A0ABQ5AAB4_9ASTR